VASGEQGRADPRPGLLRFFFERRLAPGVRCFTLSTIGTIRGSKTKYKSIYGLGLVVLFFLNAK
jgi:hypothetical protein